MTRWCGTRVFFGLMVGFCAACVDAPTIVLPSQSVPEPTFTQASTLPLSTAYSGILQPGRMVVCTSQYSPPGAYAYFVSVDGALPSDSSIVLATIDAGECAVVFETKRRGGPVPVVTIYEIQTLTSYGGVALDEDCLTDCYVPASTQSFSLTLEGFDGGIAKFYFSPPDCPVIDNVYGCFGGHGGTGTLTFQLD
jgi:hypothetical protein